MANFMNNRPANKLQEVHCEPEKLAKIDHTDN